MLYLLLIVIAVGVLLISPAGKGILKWFVIIAVIGAVLFGIMVVLVFIADYNEGLAVILGILAVCAIYKGIRNYIDYNS